MKNNFSKLLKNEEGQGLVEYSLIIVLISLIIIGASADARSALVNIFTRIADALNLNPT